MTMLKTVAYYGEIGVELRAGDRMGELVLELRVGEDRRTFAAPELVDLLTDLLVAACSAVAHGDKLLRPRERGYVAVRT